MLDRCTPWPARAAEHYRAAGYWRGKNLADLLRDWTLRFGPRIALVHDGERITYTKLGQQVDRMAAGFRRNGIAAGDRVIVQLPNIPEFVSVCFALFRIDAKPVFSLPSHRADEIHHLCALSDATGYVVPSRYRGFDYVRLAAETMAKFSTLRRVFVVDSKILAEDLDGHGVGCFVPLAEVDAEPESLSAPDSSDVAFFLLSGGTTALPKLIPRTHDDYAYQAGATAELLSLSPEDVYLAVLPVEFNFTWGCPGVIGTLCAGGTVVLADDPVADDCFEIIEREGVTFTSLVPTLAQLWLEAVDATQFNLSSLRTIQIGGAPLHHETAVLITPAFGCQLQQVFGMAEGLLTMTRITDAPQIILSTQGRPLCPDDEIRIVDDSGTDLPPGHIGELLARGPYTLRGYYGAPEHNAHAFTDDGFYRTGDLARLTDAGELVVEGRLKDVIIRGGYKINAGEVEVHLLTHSAVDRVAVVPIPDPYLGERICAYVRPIGEPPTLLALREALHDRGLADYKLPDRLEIITDLPLTGLGKVDKKFLTNDAIEKAKSPDISRSRDDIS